MQQSVSQLHEKLLITKERYEKVKSLSNILNIHPIIVFPS